MKYATYVETKQKAFNKLPIFFAFTKSTLIEEMGKVGLQPSETSKIVSIGYGGFMKKEDLPLYQEHIVQWKHKFKELLLNEDFVLDMFQYELSNHEYSVTYEDEDTLNACGFTVKEVYENEYLSMLYEKAKDIYLSYYE